MRTRRTGYCSRRAGQLRVYKAIGVPLVTALLAGRHCALLAYGQTGSGKTHSISGSPSSPGLLHRLCDELFGTLQDEIEMERADIHISYYEIYKEKVYDLLVDSNEALAVRENPATGESSSTTGADVDRSVHRASVERARHLAQRRAHTPALWRATTGDRLDGHEPSLVAQSRRLPPQRQADEDARARYVRRAYCRSTVDGTSRDICVTSRAHIVDLAGSERSHVISAARPSNGIGECRRRRDRHVQVARRHARASRSTSTSRSCS